ncbi:MAG: Uncharacterized protein LiPW15_162 [Parcubacteria group bacterium LiPW_15]|nr:MAG: Uncharacterized protein LiPW15_162 [Parcubacteria group bacterium LiPW_15]
MPIDSSYLDEIKKRKKDSKVYKEFQLTGLEIAEILDDEKHKSLYIKLAKTNSRQKLMSVAKDVADRKNVKNMGAYFMKLWKESKIAKSRKKIILAKNAKY